MNNQPDDSQPPRDVPVYLRYLLGLSSDSTREEFEREWTNQVVPLMNVGPAHLFEKEAWRIMGAGVTGDRARRILKGTKRGAMLADHAEREGKARERAKMAKPPFTSRPTKGAASRS